MAKMCLDPSSTADLLGTSRCTAFRDRLDVRNQDDPQKGSWDHGGGRRRFTMAMEEEREFLTEWEAEAKSGGVLSVPPIHVALIERLGRTIVPSYTYRMLARHGWRKVQPDTKHPKSDQAAQEELKKLPEIVAAACVKNQDNLPVRIMFQDEARFGLMSDPRSCWSPSPVRPVVNLSLIREFRYEYAAVSPWDGALDYMTTEKMNTVNMSVTSRPIHGEL